MAESEAFKDGDLVYHRSGGAAPKMVVVSYDRGDRLYLCRWFLDGKYQSASFFAHELEKASS